MATVYEARPRSGGRILTYLHGETHDELGGKFIGDGGEAGHMRALLQELGLQIHSSQVSLNRSYYHEGSRHPYPPPLDHLPSPTPALYQKLQERAKRAAHLGELLDEHLGASGIIRHLFEIRIRNYDGLSSSQLDPQDFSTFWDYYCHAFARHTTLTVETVEGGSFRLVEALTNALDFPIHYNNPLKEVAKQSGGFALQVGERSIQADYLILTNPASTLSSIHFEEHALPQDRLQTITQLGYGTNAKILIPLEQTDQAASDYCYTESAVTYFNADKSLLTLYSGGEAGCFSNPQAELEREIPALKTLYPSIVYKGEIKPIPTTQRPFVRGEGPVAINWHQEPYSIGSYSCYRPGQAARFSQLIQSYGEAVRAPFSPIDGRLFFAGEHTAIHHTATMEGAIESGERCARMVAYALNNTNR